MADLWRENDHRPTRANVGDVVIFMKNGYDVVGAQLGYPQLEGTTGTVSHIKDGLAWIKPDIRVYPLSFYEDEFIREGDVATSD